MGFVQLLFRCGDKCCDRAHDQCRFRCGKMLNCQKHHCREKCHSTPCSFCTLCTGVEEAGHCSPRSSEDEDDNKSDKEVGFKCKICDKCFKSKQGLNRHRNVHKSVLSDISNPIVPSEVSSIIPNKGVYGIFFPFIKNWAK